MPTTTQKTDMTPFPRPLDVGELKQLAETSCDPCISILMRTHQKGREIHQGPIRLKNLLGQAEQKLSEHHHSDELLDPLRAKLTDETFWQHQGEGLAIYATENECRFVRLNQSPEETVVVAQEFHLVPLISQYNAMGSYFVLALSWDDAKLYLADGETLSLVETDALPAKFDELVLPRDPEESLQNTSHRSGGNEAGTSTAMFHGHGEGEGKIEADRHQYLTLVGQEVAGALYNSGMPLVMVATSEVIGHFESATNQEVSAKVEGSPSEFTADELRMHSHEAARPMLTKDREALNERLGTARSQSTGSDDLIEVLAAAESGRVATLLIGGHDLTDVKINQAVVETLRNGGDVLHSRPEDVLGDTQVAAIFRY